MPNSSKKFFTKVFILSFPILFLLSIYIFTDPYKKIWNYDAYLYEYVMLNRGDTSTRVYIKNKDIYNYNSFIFGSSRSCSNTSKEWKKYLSKKDVPFSYGSWRDPIKGIYNKMCLIDSLNGHIDNAIIIIDLENTFHKSEYDNINYEHYLISGKSKFSYYFPDFRSYVVNPVFIITSLDYKLFQKRRSYMKGFVGQKQGDLDQINNDWEPNSDMKNYEPSAYKKNKVKFYERPIKERYSIKQIFSYEKLILLEIYRLFQKHNTKCKIIIAPLYDQIKIHPDDLLFLRKVFGDNNVYDYSGINSITNNMYNYELDGEHYKKSVGNLIYKEIYKN